MVLNGCIVVVHLMVWYQRQTEQYVMNPVISGVFGPVVMKNQSVYGGCLV